MINIFLDLDNTLISSEAFEEISPGDIDNVIKKMAKFDFTIMDDIYIICARPYLQEFLDYLFANFNVNIWTAASKDYAAFIIDKFILKNPNRKLNLVLFDKHCNASKRKYKNSKKLKMIWDLFPEGYKQNDTYIIDDLSEICDTQPDNCISVKPFNFVDKNAKNDKELKSVQHILSQIKKQTGGSRIMQKN